MGRGRSLRGGPGLGGGGGENVNVQSQLDVWSYRHRRGNEPFVDAINTAARAMEDDFPGLMGQTVTSVNAASLGGKDAITTLGFYSPADKSVNLNQRYTDIARANAAYDGSGRFHPGRGNKTAVEAVAYHELGHALSDHVAGKMGASDLHAASQTIVNAAYKNSGAKGGTAAFAHGISGYAGHNYAECVAEAVADWYCNGNNAHAHSKAIMSELRKYA